MNINDLFEVEVIVKRRYSYVRRCSRFHAFLFVPLRGMTVGNNLM